jgi:hypothetical protein
MGKYSDLLLRRIIRKHRTQLVAMSKTLKKLIQVPVLSKIPNVSTDKERSRATDGLLVWAEGLSRALMSLAGSALSYFRG